MNKNNGKVFKTTLVSLTKIVSDTKKVINIISWSAVKIYGYETYAAEYKEFESVGGLGGRRSP